MTQGLPLYGDINRTLKDWQARLSRQLSDIEARLGSLENPVSLPFQLDSVESPTTTVTLDSVDESSLMRFGELTILWLTFTCSPTAATTYVEFEVGKLSNPIGNLVVGSGTVIHSGTSVVAEVTTSEVTPDRIAVRRPGTTISAASTVISVFGAFRSELT